MISVSERFGPTAHLGRPRAAVVPPTGAAVARWGHAPPPRHAAAARAVVDHVADAGRRHGMTEHGPTARRRPPPARRPPAAAAARLFSPAAAPRRSNGALPVQRFRLRNFQKGSRQQMLTSPRQRWGRASAIRAAAVRSRTPALAALSLRRQGCPRHHGAHQPADPQKPSRSYSDVHGRFIIFWYSQQNHMAHFPNRDSGCA